MGKNLQLRGFGPCPYLGVARKGSPIPEPFPSKGGRLLNSKVSLLFKFPGARPVLPVVRIKFWRKCIRAARDAGV